MVLQWIVSIGLAILIASVLMPVAFSPYGRLLTVTQPAVPDTVDSLGITMLYPTAEGGNTWTSNWIGRSLTVIEPGDTDPLDSAFTVRGDSNMTIFTNGTVRFSGGDFQRAYVEIDHQDVEITFYGKLVDFLPTNQTFSGHDVEARTDDGHPGSDSCLGQAYALDVTYDNRVAFSKELNHPVYTAKVQNSFIVDDEEWLGVKFVIYDTPDGVQLKAYTDSTNGFNGGTWVLRNTYQDIGGWGVPSQYTDPCNIPSDYIIKGSDKPIVIFRDDGVEKDLKLASIREIDSSGFAIPTTEVSGLQSDQLTLLLFTLIPTVTLIALVIGIVQFRRGFR